MKTEAGDMAEQQRTPKTRLGWRSSDERINLSKTNQVRARGLSIFGKGNIAPISASRIMA